jgi:antitoxin component YwqK of YwqJK toxin-antitoxin module
MKKHYQTLGLNEGASQEEIQTAYERLSKELDPKNNDNQEFFVEEYQKVQDAYKALVNSSILATEKGAKQVFEKPNPSPKIKSVSPKKSGIETPKKAAVTRGIIFSIAVFSLAIIAYGIYNSLRTYKRAEIVFNKDLAYVKKDMSLLNGKINDSLHKGEFVNGMKEGFHSIQYLYTGKDTLFSNAEGQFKNNTYTGEWLFYYQSGMLYTKGVYAGSNGESKGSTGVPNSEREGLWRFWHENGQLEQEGNYLNGEMEGLWRFWHENGQLSQEGNYLNGKVEGLRRWWYENGQLSQEGNYLNGKEEGLLRTWYENGQQRSEGNYLNGKLEGLLRLWHENGQLQDEGNYLNFKREGLFRSWYENGQLKQEGNHVNGEREGLWRFWNEKGVRYSNSRYSKGEEI